MSGESPSVEPAGLYIIEDQVVNNPLRQDPQARAAYSANPGFDEGAAKPHPIHRAENSLLARADIAEALEQIHLGNQSGEADSEASAPIDTTLALDGLTWLRKNLPSNSDLRRDVIENRDKLMFQQDQETAQERAAREAAERQARSEAAAKEATEQAELQRLEQQEAQRELRETTERQLREISEAVLESYPEVSFDNFFRLAAKLAPVQNPVGQQPKVRTRKGYHAAASEVVKEGLDNPAQLINDAGITILMAKRMQAESPDAEQSHAFAYVDTVGETFFGTMFGARYAELDDTVFDAWFSAATTADAENEVETPGYGERLTASGLPVELAKKIFVNGEVLSNNLLAIAEKDPAGFIDRIHSLAYRSLEGDHIPTKFNLAMNVITKCLKNPLAGCELMRASYYVEEPELQQKALDVLMTLQEIGIPLDEIYVPGSINRIDARSKRLIINKLVPREANGAIDEESLGTIRAKELFEEFEEKALTMEGRAGTVFGRLASYTESTGLQVFKKRALADKLIAGLLGDPEGADSFKLLAIEGF